MLGFLQGPVIRVIAAITAVVLSGAPRLAGALRTASPHVCECRAHGESHRCACPVCAEQARRARRDAARSLPPCHRDRALVAVSAEEERERERDLPDLRPTCGFDEPPAAPAPPSPFVAPARPGLVARRPGPTTAHTAGRSLEVPAVPDLPPPIAR